MKDRKDITEFENLFNFLGGYFHQDWTLESSSADEVIDKFVHDGDTATTRAVILEIDRLLKAKTSENSLKEALRSLGSAYNFEADGFSASEWLRHVRSKLH
jgi:hypothetical protein